MSKVNVFLLLPEAQPSNQWMVQEDFRIPPTALYDFMLKLDKKNDEIKIENYKGYYDVDNINNFLKNYDTLEDCYPFPARTLLQTSLSVVEFYDWREEIMQQATVSYSIFAQPVKNHTFCEIAQRKFDNPDKKFLLLNHASHILGNTFEICINTDTVSIDSRTEAKEIREWFAINRHPARNFHAISKHGENRQDIRIINGETVSPLRCSEHEARTWLQTAIGDTVRELFNNDTDNGCYIVFKHEGDTPQNMYHGYHVDYTSTDVPGNIKERLH